MEKIEKDKRDCPCCGSENVSKMGLCVFCGEVACDKCGATELTYEMNKIIAHAECYIAKSITLARALKFISKRQ